MNGSTAMAKERTVSSVVVGFIPTPLGEAALERAIEEARLRSVRLVIVNSMVGGGRESEDEYFGTAEAVDALESRLSEMGLEFEVHRYVRGSTPSQDLIQAAQEFDGQLIVIGNRRRSSVGKIILGSNALEILHDAPCPVLCVRVEE
jgi:nucleotide-binding universal stress UspA family protein